MKRVVFSILAVSLLVISCKNETPEPEIVDTSNDLALAETSEISKEEYLYVTAFNGLSLREFNNLNSEKLAVMPYGTKLKVISSEDKETMTVGGIKGAMHQVEYNHKNGFAFNGYLSKAMLTSFQRDFTFVDRDSFVFSFWDAKIDFLPFFVRNQKSFFDELCVSFTKGDEFHLVLGEFV